MENNGRLSGHTDLSLREVLAELKKVAETTFEKAVPVPAAVNHSIEFFKHEMKSIFMKEWICIGRNDELSEAGDFLTQEIAGISVIVVRQKDGSIREVSKRRINLRKILSLEDIINKPYSRVTIELKENCNFNEMKKLLMQDGKTEINLIINKKNQKIHFNLKNARKFDYNQLKTMKNKEYVKKITV